MKVETQELPDSEVALSFEVEEARFERAMQDAYKRLSTQVNIAGFRRGKAPRALVERVVGRESLVEEALNHLLPEVYHEAIEETKVRALSDPEFDVESISPLKAKATVVVQPPVELGDYTGIHKEPEASSVTETDVTNVLDQLRESQAEWIPVEREANMGDRIAIDVLGTVGERTVLQNEDVEYVLNAESTAPLPGFAEQLVGIIASETREFDLVVPPDEEETEEPSELAGETMHFVVTAKDVKAKELPELDDYFATTVGAYEDLAALRTEIEGSLKERADATAKRALEDGILQAAIEGATVEIPEKLVHQNAHRMIDRLARDLDTRGLTIEQYLRITRSTEEEFHDRYHEDAERQLRRSFVLQAIAEREGLEISDAEVDQGIREAISLEGGDARAAARAIRQPEIRERARTALIEQKAASWLVEHATGGSTDAEPVAVAEATPATEGEQEA